MSPQVSVGVPVYNGERYLRQTLTALADQDMPDLQVVISDNGSDDATGEICAEFVARDPRFSYFRTEHNQGIQWNFDRAFELAEAPYFMWTAADDLPGPTHVRRCWEALRTTPDAVAAFSRVRVIDGADVEVGALDDDGLDFMTLDRPGRVELFLRRDVYQVIGYGGVIRSEVLAQLLPMRAKFYGYDGPLTVALALHGGFVQVPEQSFAMRSHDWQANKMQGGDPVRQTQAYDPDFHGRFAFPQWRLAKELILTALRGPGTPAERGRVAVLVTRLGVLRHWRMLAFDLKRNALRLRSGSHTYRGSFWSGDAT